MNASKLIAICRFLNNVEVKVIEMDPLSHADKVPYWIVEYYTANKNVEFAWLYYTKESAISAFMEFAQNQDTKLLKVF